MFYVVVHRFQWLSVLPRRSFNAMRLRSVSPSSPGCFVYTGFRLSLSASSSTDAASAVLVVGTTAVFQLFLNGAPGGVWGCCGT